MTVRGTGFYSRERVRVTLYRDGERNVRVVRAGSAGRFIARFTVMVGRSARRLRVTLVRDRAK
jgi:hypothetical protein